MVAAALRTAQVVQVVQVVQVDSSPEAVLLAAAWAWRQSWSLCPDDIYEELVSHCIRHCGIGTYDRSWLKLQM